MTWRLKMMVERFFDYIINLPLRFLRLIKWLLWMTPITGTHRIHRWLTGIILLFIDLTPVPYLFECMADLMKSNTRPLTKDERHVAMRIFKKSLPYNLISLDPSSIPVRKKQTVAFVTFHTVNFDRLISPETFIHELVHIWQYRKYGAVYISECIWAQHWGGGYNYGGLDSLIQNQESGLQAFNYEQQAEIIEEYFRLMNNLPLQWTYSSPGLEKILEKYASELWGHSSIT